jgi:Universal stress protein family
MQLKQEDRTMEIRHILAPTDFSDASNQAVTYALGLAHACGAKLSLLHVVEPLASPLNGYISADLITTLLDDLEREAHMQLAQLLSEAGAANVEVTRHVVVGMPYEIILRDGKSPASGPDRHGHSWADGLEPPGAGKRRRAGCAPGNLSCSHRSCDRLAGVGGEHIAGDHTYSWIERGRDS